MAWKNKMWRYATMVVVLLLLLNPEVASLGLFIDAVGLDLFLMLLHMQIVALASVYRQSMLKKLRNWCEYFRNYSWQCCADTLKKESVMIFLTVSTPAVIMQAVVITVILYALTNYL